MKARNSIVRACCCRSNASGPGRSKSLRFVYRAVESDCLLPFAALPAGMDGMDGFFFFRGLEVDG